jgi:hypothetical protein
MGQVFETLAEAHVSGPVGFAGFAFEAFEAQPQDCETLS